ncbi:DNA ligase 1-like [Rosa chinensis]|uniref:DNA ligase 1-like n=1 Tax=Rosa chinensis TaxID=74649 RepID=UPI000D0918A1|nr:DNA ligase 1-like [Rosa chinensis]
MADIGSIKDYINFMIDEVAKVRKQTVDPQTKEVTTDGKAKLLAAPLHSNRAKLKKKKAGGKEKDAEDEGEQENEETEFVLEVPTDKSQEKSTPVVGEADVAGEDAEREKRKKTVADKGGAKHGEQKGVDDSGLDTEGHHAEQAAAPQKRKIFASAVSPDPLKKMKIVEKNVAVGHKMLGEQPECRVGGLRKEKAEREDTITQLQEALTAKEKELVDFQSARQEEMAKMAEEEKAKISWETVEAFKKSSAFLKLLTKATPLSPKLEDAKESGDDELSGGGSSGEGSSSGEGDSQSDGNPETPTPTSKAEKKKIGTRQPVKMRRRGDRTSGSSSHAGQD